MAKTWVIGLIGGAGCGKSQVVRIFQEKLDAAVIIADDLARALAEPGGISYPKIVQTFGEEILNADGSIDRQKLASIVFSDETQLKKLNAITHPDVREEIETQIRNYRQEGRAYVILEAALLVECGYRSLCDAFWYIHADEPVRRARLKETRGYTDARIDGILRSQLDESAFRKNSDVVIDNNGSLENLELEILKNIP